MNPYQPDPEREAKIQELIRRLGHVLDATVRQSSEIARLVELLRAEGVVTAFHFGTVGAEGMVDLTVDPENMFVSDAFAADRAGPADLEWTPEDRDFLNKLGRSLP